MAPRAYLRLDVHLYDRKALGIDEKGEPIPGWQPYPPDLLVAFVGVLALAGMQPDRGRFRSRAVLVALLRGADGAGARYARQVDQLIERGDLVELAGGRLLVDGWDDWQEGDVTVAERVRRHRARRRHGPDGNADVTVDVTPDVTVDVTDDRQSNGIGISNGKGNGAVTGHQLDLDRRAADLAANRALLGSDNEAVRRAALHALRRLDPATDWEGVTT